MYMFQERNVSGDFQHFLDSAAIILDAFSDHNFANYLPLITLRRLLLYTQ